MQLVLSVEQARRTRVALASRGACVRLCDFFTRLFFVKLFFGSYKLLMDFVIK